MAKVAKSILAFLNGNCITFLVSFPVFRDSERLRSFIHGGHDVLKIFLENVIRESVAYTEHAERWSHSSTEHDKNKGDELALPPILQLRMRVI